MAERQVWHVVEQREHLLQMHAQLQQNGRTPEEILAMSAAKSGDETSAIGWPAVTRAPSSTSTRITGPEMGASTWVLWLPSNATVPVTSTVGENESAARGATWMT